MALDTPLVPQALPGRTGAPRRVGPGVLSGSAAFVDHGVVDIDLTRDTLVIAGDEAWEVPGLEHVPTIAEPTAPTPFHQVHPLAARFSPSARWPFPTTGATSLPPQSLRRLWWWDTPRCTAT
ncbi:hypothetical protein [Corynebacterium aquatimens]|uniref:hypothetical protein n=1 Tax=Corynebacterium aquatimens TaxID=1190508 RepID=UPI003EB9629B